MGVRTVWRDQGLSITLALFLLVSRTFGQFRAVTR